MKTTLVRNVVIASLLAATVVSCFATATRAESTGTYQDALRQCGAEWRASDARNNAAKGQRADAWQAFRRECVTRVGWQSKRGNRAATAN